MMEELEYLVTNCFTPCGTSDGKCPFFTTSPIMRHNTVTKNSFSLKNKKKTLKNVHIFG